MPRVSPGLSMNSIPPTPCILPPSIASSPASSSIRTLSPSISSSSASSSRTMSRRSSRSSGSSHSNDNGVSVSNRGPTPTRSSQDQRSPSPPEPVRELGSAPLPTGLPEITTSSAQPSSSRSSTSHRSPPPPEPIPEVTELEHEPVSHVSPPPVMLPARHNGSASGSQAARRSPVENTSPAASVHGSHRSSRHSSRSSHHSTSHHNVQAVLPLSTNQGLTSGRSQTNSRPNSITSSPGSHGSSSQNSSRSHRSSRSAGAVSSPPPPLPPTSMSSRSARLPAAVSPSQGSTSSRTTSSRTSSIISSSASLTSGHGSHRSEPGGSRHSTRTVPNSTQRGQPAPSHRGVRVDTSQNSTPRSGIPSDESPLSPSDSDSGYESSRARDKRHRQESRRAEERRREEARHLEAQHPQPPRNRRPPTPGPRAGIHLFPAGPDEPPAFIPPLDGDVDEPTVEVTPPSPPLTRPRPNDILPTYFPTVAGGMPPVFPFSPLGSAQFPHTPPVYPSTPPFVPDHGGFVPSEPPVYPSNVPPPFRNDAPVIPGVNTPYPGRPAFPNVGHTPPVMFFENTPTVIPASTLNTPVPLPPLPLGPVPQELHYQLKQYYNPLPHDTNGYVSTPSLQWDIVHRPEDTARFLHDMSPFGNVEPDWDADAFRPNTPRLVQFTSTHPIMRFLFAHRPCILDSPFESIKVGQILVHLYHYLHEPLTANELEWLKQTPANVEVMRAALESRYRHTLGTAPQEGASFLRSDVMGGHRRFYGMQLSARPNGQWKLCVDFISGPVPKLW